MKKFRGEQGLLQNLKTIRFVNSVCTIFGLRKQGTNLLKLASAISLRKEGTCAGTVYKTNGL